MFPRYLTEEIKSHNKEKGYSDTMLGILEEELSPKQEKALKKILSGKLRIELEKIVDKLEGRKIKASGEKQAIEKISQAVEDMKDLEAEAKKMAKSGDEVSDTEIDSLLKQYENIWKKNKGALKSTLRTAAKAGISIAGLLGIMSGVGGFAIKKTVMSNLEGVARDAADDVKFTKYIEKFWNMVINLLTTGDPGKLSASEFLSASGVIDAAKSRYGL